jgi:hypothetical protein
MTVGPRSIPAGTVTLITRRWTPPFESLPVSGDSSQEAPHIEQCMRQVLQMHGRMTSTFGFVGSGEIGSGRDSFSDRVKSAFSRTGCSARRVMVDPD